MSTRNSPSPSTLLPTYGIMMLRGCYESKSSGYIKLNRPGLWRLSTIWGLQTGSGLARNEMALAAVLSSLDSPVAAHFGGSISMCIQVLDLINL